MALRFLFVPKVVFRTFGQLTAFSKHNQLDIQFNGETVQDFLGELENRLGDGIKLILYPDGKNFSPMIFILVNGKNIQQLDGLKTKLKDGDILSILPVTAGG